MQTYKQLKSELGLELQSILSYWVNNTIDTKHGGFLGRIDHCNTVIPNASKGIILNTRILWSFSAASNHLKTDSYRDICDRAFQYLYISFRDTLYKGVFWEVDYLGNPINTRKQVYAQAYAIYALSEYYIYTKNDTAKDWAIEIFECLEKYAKDTTNLGYIEAFNEDWSTIADMRLSDKDINASKTMNTHLHVLEAYTVLLKIYDSPKLKTALKTLVDIFFNTFLNKDYHFDLFFDTTWNLLSNTVSYGHDIEAAWLIIEAVKALDDDTLRYQANCVALNITNTFLTEGIATDGSALNEKNIATNHIDTDRHWWPQVEALIGLKYAYELNQNEVYIEASNKIWAFTRTHLIDREHGEWFFRVDENGIPYPEEDKVSMWKAPYHTVRACIIVGC